MLGEEGTVEIGMLGGEVECSRGAGHPANPRLKSETWALMVVN